MTLSTSPRIEFGVTPRFDVFYALYALSSATPTPLDAWKSIALDRLPRDFQKRAGLLAPVPIFWPLLADAAQSVQGEISFEELVSTIRELHQSELQRNILTGIFHDEDAVDSLIGERRTLKQIVSGVGAPGRQLLTAFGLQPFDGGSAAVRAITSLLKRPEPFRKALTDLLEAFWNSGFHDDWRALEPGLRDESFRMRDLRDDGGAANLDVQLNLPITIDEVGQQIRPKSGNAIPYEKVERCFVIPSAFNARRWWTKYKAASGKLVLYFPIARDLAAASRIFVKERVAQASTTAPATDVDAESVFRALGDTTRYAIASILARTPTTSAELARNLNVSKPTITHHVHALRSAGLIKETPSGGSTKLSLSRDTLAALSGAVVEQLFSSSGELTLGTTRKKRNG
jgi:DNA-binding transcriptional ArsR family regulator